VAPLLAALCVAVALRRSRLLGLAVGAAFATVIMRTIGFTFESLTSSRKMVVMRAGGQRTRKRSTSRTK
jgi:hypothetical protein